MYYLWVLLIKTHSNMNVYGISEKSVEAAKKAINAGMGTDIEIVEFSMAPTKAHFIFSKIATRLNVRTMVDYYFSVKTGKLLRTKLIDTKYL